MRLLFQKNKKTKHCCRHTEIDLSSQTRVSAAMVGESGERMEFVGSEATVGTGAPSEQSYEKSRAKKKRRREEG